MQVTNLTGWNRARRPWRVFSFFLWFLWCLFLWFPASVFSLSIQKDAISYTFFIRLLFRTKTPSLVSQTSLARDAPPLSKRASRLRVAAILFWHPLKFKFFGRQNARKWDEMSEKKTNKKQQKASTNGKRLLAIVWCQVEECRPAQHTADGDRMRWNSINNARKEVHTKAQSEAAVGRKVQWACRQNVPNVRKCA